eukprot:2082832-Amphidinium_carterae.1
MLKTQTWRNQLKLRGRPLCQSRPESLREQLAHSGKEVRESLPAISTGFLSHAFRSRRSTPMNINKPNVANNEM